MVRPEREAEQEVVDDNLVGGQERLVADAIGRLVGEQVDEGDVWVEDEAKDDWRQ